jgi:transketolase
VQELPDARIIGAIDTAIQAAKADKTHPSLIIVHTEIAHGTPKRIPPARTGEPLGEDAIKAMREFLPLERRTIHGSCGRAGIFPD